MDLRGVNAQEKSKQELLKSLMIGAEDMLATEIPFEPGFEMMTVEVPNPEWVSNAVTA